MSSTNLLGMSRNSLNVHNNSKNNTSVNSDEEEEINEGVVLISIISMREVNKFLRN